MTAFEEFGEVQVVGHIISGIEGTMEVGTSASKEAILHEKGSSISGGRETHGKGPRIRGEGPQDLREPGRSARVRPHHLRMPCEMGDGQDHLSTRCGRGTGP